MILLIQYVWKAAYLWKGIPGIYWLFVFLDQMFLPGIAITTVTGAIFLVLRKFSGSTKYKRLFFLVSLSLFVLSVSIVATFPMVLANNHVHLQRVRVEERIYYLGAYPLFDINFYVAECDSLGILCRKIYRSGDILDTAWENSKLGYDERVRVLKLHTPEKGMIFRYQVPEQ